MAGGQLSATSDVLSDRETEDVFETMQNHSGTTSHIGTHGAAMAPRKENILSKTVLVTFP